MERLYLTLALLCFLLLYVYIVSRKYFWRPQSDPVITVVLTLLASLWGLQSQ